MAHPDNTPELLTDRTLIHGRNIMALSATILALTFFPDINISDFEPFGFKVGKLSLWIILAIVLAYYTVRFSVDCWAEYHRWKDAWDPYAKPGPADPKNPDHVNAHRMRQRFWWLDFGLPIGMAVAALGTVAIQIYKLS